MLDICLVDVVPVQPTNICDIGLAALGRFGHKEVNIVRNKASTFFSTILAFTVQKSCTHKNPPKQSVSLVEIGLLKLCLRNNCVFGNNNRTKPILSSPT
jgi:hypothetical protein